VPFQDIFNIKLLVLKNTSHCPLHGTTNENFLSLLVLLQKIAKPMMMTHEKNMNNLLKIFQTKKI
jgi:hypothetical protein